ncbi:MAG: flagellar hook-associated protein FlgK [Turicibacter sp.]
MANSLFGMMNSSASGLMASQILINTTANNLYNSDREGYTRQRVLLSANSPIYYRGTGYLGAGVNIDDIQRLRDQHLDGQIYKETSSLKENQAKLDALKELETIFNEPSDTGLNAIMKDFWNGWDEISKNPENTTMQEIIKQNGQMVADQLNEFANKINSSLEGIDKRQESAIASTVDLINNLNEINKQLKEAHNMDPTRTPNELLDQRDALVKKISETIPVDIKYNNDFTIEMTSTLQDGTKLDVLGLQGTDDATTKANLEAVIPNLTSGSLKGNAEVKNSFETNYLPKLNEYTKALADSINKIQVDNGGVPFFTYDATDPLGSISVNKELMDGTADIVVGVDGAGDGSVARAILNIRDTKLSINGRDTTLNQFYQDVIGEVGIETKNIASKKKNNETMLGYLDAKYESLSGVSKDEEMSFLIQYQKSYEANARVITTITDMLDTIINRMGV